MPYKDSEANRASKSQWAKEQKKIIRLLKQSPDGADPLWVEGQRLFLLNQGKAQRLWDHLSDPERAHDAERARQRVRRHREKKGESGRIENRERASKWREEHPEERQAYNKAHWEANKEKLQKKNADYHAANAEAINARHRAATAANPGARQAYQATYQAEHPEAIRLYAAARRARKRNLPDTFTIEERQFMLEYWHHACAICGNQDGFFWTLADDHWICITSPDCPGTVAENMIPLCHGKGGCNN